MIYRVSCSCMRTRARALWLPCGLFAETRAHCGTECSTGTLPLLALTTGAIQVKSALDSLLYVALPSLLAGSSRAAKTGHCTYVRRTAGVSEFNV